ncbi:MAG: cation:proton antiporter [Acidobacteriaceae bacterium]
MNEAHHVTVVVLLALVAIFCWLGVIGIVRMREPVQALHYLALPAGLGMILLTIAVFVQTGASQASAKCVLILFLMLGFNSIGTHAAARAFRARELGHWESYPEDDVECLDLTRPDETGAGKEPER